MSTENKNVVRRMVEEGWNKGNEKIMDELIAPDAQLHDPTIPNAPRGPQAMKQQMMTYRGAFPDLRMTIDQQTAEGDIVTTRWTCRGTHEAPLMGAPATHRRVTVVGIQVDRITDGKFRESWVVWDAAGLLQQVGVMPPLSAGPAATATRGMADKR